MVVCPLLWLDISLLLLLLEGGHARGEGGVLARVETGGENIKEGVLWWLEHLRGFGGKTSPTYLILSLL